MSIRWEPATFTEEVEHLGHGFFVVADEPEQGPGIPSMAVTEFAWLRHDREAVIHYDRQRLPADPVVAAELKSCFEAWVRARRLRSGRLIAGYTLVLHC